MCKREVLSIAIIGPETRLCKRKKAEMEMDKHFHYTQCLLSGISLLHQQSKWNVRRMKSKETKLNVILEMRGNKIPIFVK